MLNKRSLSSRQKRILEHIERFLNDNGYPPTVRDIVTGCNISSTSVADYNLDILEREGYIRRHRDVSRGIELLGTTAPRTKALVPLIGRVAAGKPIPVPSADTWDNVSSSDKIEVTADLTKGKKQVYALKVKGTSMIDALINDGDVVLMESTSTIDNGDLAAVWLKNEKEATLKKIYVERDRIRLQPANKQMSPIYTTPDNVEIQGKVIAVIRKL